MFMNRTKKVMTMGLSVILGSTLLISGVSAATGTKKLDALYNNIKVTYNGQQREVSPEPFMINNSVYVPVRAVSELTGAEVKWGNNTVQITGGNSGGTATESQIAEKNYQIAKLTQENATLKEKLAQYEGTGSGTGSTVVTDQTLAATLKYLETNYEDSYDVDWDFALAKKGSKLMLTVEYDSRYSSKEFNKIEGTSKLKGLMEDLCEEIRNRHKDIEITGELNDSRSSRTYATFSYSKSDKFNYDIERTPESLSNLERTLERDYTSINNLTTSTKTFNLPISDISLTERNGILLFTVKLTITGENRDNWNKLDKNGQYKVEDLIDKIAGDLEYEYDDLDIEGEIKDSTTDRSIYTYDGSRYYYKDNLSL